MIIISFLYDEMQYKEEKGLFTFAHTITILMETTSNKIMEKVVESLKKAAVELEEFQLQFALGKADATDKYEELKKKFDLFLHESKHKFQQEKFKAEELKAKLENLQLQLALGKAETREVFEAQMKKILSAMNQLETFLKNSELGSEVYTYFHNEIQKFKIKLDILKLRFELGKMEAKEEFESRKSEFSKHIESLKEKAFKKESAFEKNWDGFKNEVDHAYDRLKHVFVK